MAEDQVLYLSSSALEGRLDVILLYLKSSSVPTKEMMEMIFSGSVKQTWIINIALERSRLHVKDLTIQMILIFLPDHVVWNTTWNQQVEAVVEEEKVAVVDTVMAITRRDLQRLETLSSW